MRVTYIGHATVLLEMDGICLLTDPVLSHRVFHFRRRFLSDSPIPKQEISAILISHTHRDHFDLPTLEGWGINPDWSAHGKSHARREWAQPFFPGSRNRLPWLLGAR